MKELFEEYREKKEKLKQDLISKLPHKK